MRKAFWDPQDTEDRERLDRRLLEIEREIERAQHRNNDDDLAELRAELDDMLRGLTDDTRYRVQDLIDKIDGEKSVKSADLPPPGAHAVYR